jgi:APA family basic amino acid/polyamine antiporter
MAMDDDIRRPRTVGHLLRVLGLAFGLAVVVGGVIGQGIFRAPGLVADNVPNPWAMLALWALGGLLVLIDACALVELGTSIPCAGGPYAFAHRAFGRIGGTVVGWADALNWTVVVAFLSVVFAEYVHRLGIAPDLPGGLLSGLLIAACWAVNWTGTRISGASQTMFSAIKGIILILLVVALASRAGPIMAQSDAPPMAPVVGIAALLGAMRAVIGTYGGWWTTSYFGEEMVDAERNVARATFGGILTVAALYLAVNAAMLHVLTPARMAVSKLPAADAAATVFGSASGSLMTGVAILSVVALTNLVLMLVSRIGFGMARDRVLPALLARVSASGTPRPALTVVALLAGAIAASGTYKNLLTISVAFTVAIVGAVDLAAIVMRRNEPNLPRPFKMPLFPLPALIGLLINGLLLIAMLIDDPWSVVISVGVAALLGVGYALGGRAMPAPAH